MKTLNDTIDELELQVASMQDQLAGVRDRLLEAKGKWADHQVVGGQTWHTRDETPPDGWIWASDGVRVWIIMGRGKPLSAGATAALYWCDALIPGPPELS